MFERVATDRTSGASFLTRLAARELSDAVGPLSDADPGTLWDALVAACRELLTAGRDMAPIVNLAGSVLSAAERVVLSGRGSETAVLAVQTECGKVWEFGEERLQELGNEGSRLVESGATVATTSSSESVRAVLEAAARAGASFEVLLSESRPNLEGTGLARRLADLGVRSILTTDAALPGMVSEADLVLLGADSVSERSFVNKIGSYALALAAREAHVVCYAVALRDKFLPEGIRGNPEAPREATELMPDPPDSVTVENRYFEVVPLGFVRGIVTERGTFSPDDVPGQIRERPVPPALLQILFSSAPPEARGR